MTLPQAVLLDRDGTLIEDRHYLSDPEGVVLLPGVGEGLARLAAAGCRLFLVSNQSGVGRGYFSEDAVRSCQERLESLLRPYGVLFEDAVWCPHAPAEDCRCRKPLPGLWERLRDRHGLDPRHCLMAGDKMDDLLFAVNAGLATGLLVLTGKGKDRPSGRGCLFQKPAASLLTPSPSPRSGPPRAGLRFRSRDGLDSLRAKPFPCGQTNARRRIAINADVPDRKQNGPAA